MGRLMSIVTPLHTKTKRDYLARMNDDKASCMKIAKRYDRDYWDGDRRFGYGGYKYDGRWRTVAEKLIETYGLSEKSKILDIGCGKGFLLYELKKLLPGVRVAGFDISKYAIENAKEGIREYVFIQKAQDPYPFKDMEFDLAISINVLFNLPVPELKRALEGMERAARNKYIVLESYRNEKELFNLQCWALTCETFLGHKEWIWLFKEFGYTGDYEFIYFE